MVDFSEEYKMLHLRLEVLKKEFADLFTLKNEMLSYDENYLTALYLSTIGQKQFELHCLRIEVAMIKQRIELIQDVQNNNEHLDLQSIDIELNKRFEEYQRKIEEEAMRLTVAKEYLKTEFLTDEAADKLRNVFRLIVKKLHPDINPILTEHEKDLFVKAQVAYELCDLTILNEILLSLNRNPDSLLSLEPLDLKEYVAKLDEAVRKLKQQTKRLERQFPFNYRNKLDDAEWVESEIKSLSVEIAILLKEKEKASEYMLLLQLWKPASLN